MATFPARPPDCRYNGTWDGTNLRLNYGALTVKGKFLDPAPIVAGLEQALNEAYERHDINGVLKRMLVSPGDVEIGGVFPPLETNATTADGIANAIVLNTRAALESLLPVKYTPEAAWEAAQQRSGGQAMYTTPAHINPATGFMWQSLMDQDFLEWPNVPMQELPTVYMDEFGVESYIKPEWAKGVGEKVRTVEVAGEITRKDAQGLTTAISQTVETDRASWEDDPEVSTWLDSVRNVQGSGGHIGLRELGIIRRALIEWTLSWAEAGTAPLEVTLSQPRDYAAKMEEYVHENPGAFTPVGPWLMDLAGAPKPETEWEWKVYNKTKLVADVVSLLAGGVSLLKVLVRLVDLRKAIRLGLPEAEELHAWFKRHKGEPPYPGGSKKALKVASTGSINGKPPTIKPNGGLAPGYDGPGKTGFIAPNQKAIAPDKRRHTPTLISEEAVAIGKKKNPGKDRYPSDLLSNSHAEVAWLQHAYESKLLKAGDNVTLSVVGEKVCRHCRRHLPLMAKKIGLESMVVIDKAAGIVYSWHPGMTQLKFVSVIRP